MKIVILDTDCSNLLSVKLSIERLGYFPEITCNSSRILSADRVIFPGIGTALSIMNKLNKFNLIKTIKKFKKPMLGICLGMQVLSSFSMESNGIKMLGIIDSNVSLLESNGLVLPHIGWNNVFIKDNHPLFKNINNKSRFYFVHSYSFPIGQFTIASSFYGQEFSAVIQKDNFFGVQFHPEKSSFVGSQLLKNFLEIL
ncbi:Imidazole glycerol phosphate synthase subunit HisH [Buchnera aphidicola (Tetraneura ulmi)]|uniref:imidazole glycerol phosphate synthase subunit HisH n=1 Tax=Buchnera aphidicola TaxID=9 RepID=UPI003463AA19